MYNPEFINEKDAEKTMKEIGVGGGIVHMLPKTKFRLIKLQNVRNAIANILKQEMLAIGGDCAVNQGTVNCTIEKTDVLLMGTLKHYKELIKKMKIQVSESKDVAEAIENIINKL